METQIDSVLLEKLTPYKLKIMADVDGSTYSVQCVIRVSITPYIRMFSDEVWYKASHVIPRAGTFEAAVNICMKELVDRLDSGEL